MSTTPPWWVPYIFLAVLVAASFTFTLLGRMTPAEFLAFAAALGFRVPPTQEQRPVQPQVVKQMDVTGENVTVEEEPKPEEELAA